MSQAIRVQAVSWSQVDRLVRGVAAAIRASGFQPDLVVAIARGGFVPARLLCDWLGVMELSSFRIEHYRGQQAGGSARVRQPLAVDVGGRRVLVVDDLSDTGETFEAAVRHLAERGAADVRTAALHHKAQSRFEPDYYARCVRKWRWMSYPWARLEDVGALIRGLEAPWGEAADIAARLQSRHGLKVAAQTVADALVLLRLADGSPIRQSL